MMMCVSQSFLVTTLKCLKKQVNIKEPSTDNRSWKIPIDPLKFPHPIQSTPRGTKRAPKEYLNNITYCNRGYGARIKSDANGIINLDQTKQDLAQYLSAARFSPVKSTLLCAICKKYIIAWPCFTTQLISKHLPKGVAMAMKILDQKFKTWDLPNWYLPPTFKPSIIQMFPLSKSHRTQNQIMFCAAYLTLPNWKKNHIQIKPVYFLSNQLQKINIFLFYTVMI